MRLRTLKLVDFRCFRDATIDLSADVVAIYGRNGVGKTAIFDAIEVALLGNIGRFESPEDEGVDFLSHVDGRSGFRIELTFDRDEFPPLTASADRQHPGQPVLQVDGRATTHRDLLYGHLVHEDFVPARREVSAVREMFRSTSLLSQSTVARFIRKSPDDRHQVLAHLAGIGFYRRCLDKALAVKAEAEKRIRRQGEGSQQRTDDISSLRAELANREARIESIRNTLESSAPTRDDVLAAIQQLEEAVQIDLPPDTGSPGELAAAVRGICDERGQEFQELGRKLHGLAVSMEGVPGWVARQQDLQSRLASSQTSLDRLVQAETEQTDRLETIEADLRTLDQGIASAAQREKSLRRLIDLRSRRRGLCDRQEAIERERGPAHDRLKALEEEREGVATRLGRLQTEVAERRHTTEQLAARLHRMQDLRTRYGEYDRARERESELKVRIAELTSRQPDLQLRLQRITNDSAVAERRHDELKATVGRIAAKSTELGQLLGRIKAYVTGRTCPLCGYAHASQQDLLHAIDTQIQSLPAEQQEIARQLHEVDSQRQRVSAELSSLRNKLSGVERDLVSARDEQASLVELTRRLDAEAYAAGVSMLPEILDSRIRDVESELAQLETQRHTDEQRAEEGHELLNQLEVKREALAKQDASFAAELQTISGKLRDINVQIAQLGLPDDAASPISPAQVMDDVQRQLVDLTGRRTERTADRNTAKQQQAAVANQRKAMDGTLAEARQQLAEINTRLGQHQQQCVAAGLRSDAQAADVEEARRTLNARLAQLEEVLQTVNRYESNARATQLDAEKADLSKRLAELEQQAASERQAGSRLKEASVRVQEWAALLDEGVSRAVEMRVCAHRSDITRLFKSMIPCPYLFEDIVMGSDLQLGLRYRGKSEASGEPRLFLSEAQANVLALSIFLSFSMRQEWSKLNTVLLDDPVQHLDDLDAVALLDNLRAVALGHTWRRRQVVVSTCDKNLYLLLLRKMSSIGLRFTGFSLLERGLDGPEVHYDVGGPSEDGRMPAAV